MVTLAVVARVDREDLDKLEAAHQMPVVAVVAVRAAVLLLSVMPPAAMAQKEVVVVHLVQMGQSVL